MGAGTGTRLAGLGLGAVTFMAPAQAASISAVIDDPYLFAASMVALAALGCAAYYTRRLSKREKASRQKLGDMEIRLNEAEAVLSAETHVLVIWRGRDAERHGGYAVEDDVTSGR